MIVKLIINYTKKKCEIFYNLDKKKNVNSSKYKEKEEACIYIGDQNVDRWHQKRMKEVRMKQSKTIILNLTPVK